MLKKQGFSVAMLAAMVIVISILVTTITISIDSTIKYSKLRVFANELQYIQDTVDEEYSRSAVLDNYVIDTVKLDLSAVDPAIVSQQFPADNIIDGNIMLEVLDLSALKIKNTIYGNGDSALDYYAVCVPTGKVYYIAGYKAKATTYYTLTDDLKNISKLELSDNNLSTSVVFKPSVIGWTNQAVKVVVKVPVAFSNITISASANDKVVSEITEADGYKVATVNTTDLIGNYDIVVGYSENGVTKSAKYSVNSFDSTLPNAASINATVDGSIKANVNVTDSQSKINLIRSKYIITKDSTAYDINSEVWTSSDAKSFTSTTEKISKALTYGDYYIQVLSVDNAGNKKVDISSRLVVVFQANGPVLDSKMIPVVYNASDNSWIPATSTQIANNNWYRYESQVSAGNSQTAREDNKTSKWANAKTEDGSYFVWIPRFAFKITYYTDNTYATTSYTKTEYGLINVVFLEGKTNYYYNSNGKKLLATENGYTVHPAFRNGTNINYANGEWNEEISGIWVAKYEMSRADATITTIGTSDNIKSMPSVKALNAISLSNSYLVSQNYNPALNSHMLKDSEYGALIYLTYSQYGRNGNEVSVNECDENITGAGPSTNGVYLLPYSYSESNFANTYAYNTTFGKLASTTGNVYGVYDLAGGLNEFSAGYLVNDYTDPAQKDSLTDSRYLNGKSLIDIAASLGNRSTSTKYVTVYSKGATDAYADNYEVNSDVIGNGIYKTSTSGTSNTSWFGDNSYFPYTSTPYILRSGLFTGGQNGGMFSFKNGTGEASSNSGFRVALIVE